MRLLFAGECMVELAPDGTGYRKGFAGDTFNMAWYARRLAPAAWQVGYLTALGQDAVSDDMAAFMADAGIDTAHVQRRADRTVGLYLISLRDGERSFAYWRGQSAARRMADDPALLDAACDGADLVCLSGITVAVLEEGGRDRLADALARYRAAGGRVAFDPNIRPRLWSTPQELRSEITRFAGLSDILLASFDDEAAHFGDAAPAATLARYRAAGVPVVVVKDGGKPIHADWNGTHLIHTPKPVAQIVDTTAAGDSFNAAFLVALLKGEPPEDCLRRGASLSRAVIGYRGALSTDAARR